MANSNSNSSWLLIFAVATIAALIVAKLLFPQIIEQMAAGIVAFFIFLFGVIFRRNQKRN